MPDYLSGEVEQDVKDLIKSFEEAQLKLDPETEAAGIESFQLRIDLLSQTIEEEIPTPRLCPDCNPRDEIPALHCVRSGHEIGEDGFAIDRPAYLPLGVKP